MSNKSRLGPAIALQPIGWIESILMPGRPAPLQADEGAPEASLVFASTVGPALKEILPGDRLVVITWLDRARRDRLRVHPRDDPTKDEIGVFATRSADRPNPIGLHEVEVLEVIELELRVANLEAFDGTPILDLKPLLGPILSR